MAEASTFAAPAQSSASTANLNSGVSTDKSSTADTSVSDLLYTYEDEVRSPYVADYLNIRNIWDKEPVMAREVRNIEQHLRSLVVTNRLDNNVKAAEKYLNHIEAEAGIEPFENANRRIAKLLKYLEFRKVVDS